MNSCIYGINGPVVTVKNTKDFFVGEMVFVGKERLIGEVISVATEDTLIQVYEETAGLSAGEEIVGTKSPISVDLGPGLIGNIFDGIERPLKEMEKKGGAFISRGGEYTSLNEEKQWEVTVLKKPGERIKGGEIFATVKETESITQKIMCPVNVSGEITFAAESGNYTVNDTVLKVKPDKNNTNEIAGSEENEVILTLKQRWPIRKPRPIKNRLPVTVPLITGQRVIDSLFPLSKGGTAAIQGGFGTGKTMTQHQLAKWCDADIIIYVGCGERGNELTQVLDEFSALIDPRTKKPLLSRTVLIANTSNMPVAAREASIYTGITLAEYFRDMGYHVAMMADSTSRWAEALREISGRLEEMPAEEGFPAYLPSRLAEFYERAGRVTTLNGNEGSVSVIGAVSPQGADFSEPVTQNTKRFTRAFWALDKNLAYERHYPAINWMESYSEYADDLADYFNKNVDEKFFDFRQQIINILREENSLMEIVKLIGADVLPDDQKLVIEVAKAIRLGFLQQNAFHKDDTYVPLKKQFLMMNVFLTLYKEGKKIVAASKPVAPYFTSGVFEKAAKLKYDIDNEHFDKFDDYLAEIKKAAEDTLNG